MSTVGGRSEHGAARRSRKSGGAILAASSFRVITNHRITRMVNATMAGGGIRYYSRRQRRVRAPADFPPCGAGRRPGTLSRR